LKQLGLAMHVFHDVHKSLPPHARYSPDGKPLLSWRVLILPHLDQDQLHGQFRLDEPWDSPHNRTLIDKMPPFYRSPGSKLKEKGRTNYVVVVGPETVFSGREGTPLTDIKDGASNTIMIVECDDQRAPIWTKPDDLPFDSTNPAKGLGRLYERRGFNAVFCDGSVRFLTPTMPPEKLRALFTKAGGEPVGD
jgi:prepilin-type processing-associated H-X9-DG protein